MAGYSIRNIGIIGELDRMEKDMQDLKNRQFIGNKTLKTKTTRSNFVFSHDAWFFEPSGPPQLQAAQHEILFKADRQKNPYGFILIEFFDLSGNQITKTSSDYTDGPVIDEIYYHVTHVDDGLLKFEVWTAGPPLSPYKQRFVIAATDSGSVIEMKDVYDY